jgi:hypothetical protein
MGRNACAIVCILCCVVVDRRAGVSVMCTVHDVLEDSLQVTQL